MKSKLSWLAALILAAAFVSCGDDDKKSQKGDPDLTHEGEQWNILSIEYDLIDQNISGGGVGQTVKSDTKANAGTFYFKNDNSGSFELLVEGYNKEDVFNYEIDADQLSIVEVSQSVGAKTNQNVLALSGDIISETERTLSGTIVKQSTTGQFILTVEIVLKKK